MFGFFKNLKPAARILLLIVAAGVLFLVASWTGLIGFKPMEALVPKTAELADAPTSNVNYDVPLASMPGTVPTNRGKSVVIEHWFWNTQMGIILANGGKETTVGSLMEKHGVKLTLKREDDAEKMKADLLAFAEELEGGNPNPSKGTAGVMIMGDGAPAFLTAVNKTIRDKYGKEYIAEVVGILGKSAGEDKLMVKPEIVGNPQALKGKVLCGYLRDGDWNIAIKLAGDNQIRNNPDTRTFDPDAINWIAADTYIDAAQKYVTGYTETKKVIKNGKLTGEEVTVGIDGVVTWYPGDKIIAEQKGGLVTYVSTKEYSSQMPNTLIMIKKWANDNRSTVKGILAAAYEGADQVKVHPEMQRKAAELSAKVYNNEASAKEILEAFNGKKIKDKQGYAIVLGGSSVCNLADAMQWLGVAEGSANIYATTYTTFAEILKQQYPKLFPNYDPVSDILDVSFVRELSSEMTVTQAEKPEFTESMSVSNVVSAKDYTITFATGSAEFSGSATKVLNEIYNSTIIADALYINVTGHTDNVGDPESNRVLSEKRAEAVKEWLQHKAASKYPNKRFIVEGAGDTQPKASNSTETGRAQNRRVEIKLGSN